MRLLDQYGAACKVRRLAVRTIPTYRRWVEEFLGFQAPIIRAARDPPKKGFRTPISWVSGDPCCPNCHSVRTRFDWSAASNVWRCLLAVVIAQFVIPAIRFWFRCPDCGTRFLAS